MLRIAAIVLLVAFPAAAAPCTSGPPSANVDAATAATGRLRFDAGRVGALIDGMSIQEMARYVGNLAAGGTPRGYEQALTHTFTLSRQRGEAALLRHLVDYDGDGYHTVRLLAHDLDNDERVARVLQALAAASREPRGVKLLTDVDDTLYANLVDPRYRHTGALYPGVEALYRAVATEPEVISAVAGRHLALATLSARPQLRGFDSARENLGEIAQKFDAEVCAMSLGGELVSSGLGTLFTFYEQGRPPTAEQFDAMLGAYGEGEGADLGFLARQETEIGRVKFSNYKRFTMVYPEYHYVFFGDSGQADAYAANLMMEHNGALASPGRALVTFIHDLRFRAEDGRQYGISPTPLVHSAVRNPNVVLFRNHVHAARQAFERYRDGLLAVELVDSSELLDVVTAALTQLDAAEFSSPAAAARLGTEFSVDAAAALRALRRSGVEVPIAATRLVADVCRRHQAPCDES